MEQSMALAALGESTVSPNPCVGCIIVREGRAVGCGWHRAAGEPHAEALAARTAGSAARGATVYLNLEPCAHHGRTPPCVDLLIESGVRRVVASLRDPNPLVDGRGFARLEEAGIEVDIGLLAQDAARLNAPFLTFQSRGRPVVTLKAAASTDGMLAAAGGRSRWISGASARRVAHRFRLTHDAILVGANTVRRDDPLLTVRLPGVSAARLRVVLSESLDLDPAARVFQPSSGGGPRPRLYTGASTERAAARFAGRADVLRAPTSPGGLDLEWVLRDLAACGVQSLLVEGGGNTVARFLDAGLADRMLLFAAPRLLGHRGGVPLVDHTAVDDPAGGWTLSVTRRIMLDEDVLAIAEVRRGGEAPAIPEVGAGE
jgi:diaminohydroxyphosphoribosylaminopyrimidine deaminase/5-amino-6-(5-phosphoribosylamino)uracil reductase